MDYNKNMRTAANRHFEAAEQLVGGHRKDVAGYLYGISAECAIKEIMLRSGMRPLDARDRRDDPFYAHFEVLKTLLRDGAYGRLATVLNRMAQDNAFMQCWDTSMRYSDGREIDERRVKRWRADAQLAISAMDN